MSLQDEESKPFIRLYKHNFHVFDADGIPTPFFHCPFVFRTVFDLLLAAHV